MEKPTKNDVSAAAIHAVQSFREFQGCRPLRTEPPSRVALIEVNDTEEGTFVNRIRVRGFFAANVPNVETMVDPDDASEYDTLAVVVFTEQWQPVVTLHDVATLLYKRKLSNRSKTMRTLQAIAIDNDEESR